MRANQKRVWLVGLGLATYVGILLFPRTSQPAATKPSEAQDLGGGALLEPATAKAATHVAKPAAAAAKTRAAATTQPSAPTTEGTLEPGWAEENLEPYERTAPTPLSDADLQVRAAERRMLDHRWAAQSTDMEWTAAMIAKAEQAVVEQQLSPHSVHSVDCRGTICRLELASVGGENALKLIDAGRSLHNETWVDHREATNDAWTLEVFVSHPEYRLSGDGGKI